MAVSPERVKASVLLRMLVVAFLCWTVWTIWAFRTQTGQHWFSLVLGLLIGAFSWSVKYPLLPRAGRIVNGLAVAMLTWLAILAGRFGAEFAAINHDYYWGTYRVATPGRVRLQFASDLVSKRWDAGEKTDWPTQPRTGGEPMLAKYPAEIEQAVQQWWDQMTPADQEMSLQSLRNILMARRRMAHQLILRNAFEMAYQGENLFWIISGSLFAGLLTACRRSCLVSQCASESVEQAAT